MLLLLLVAAALPAAVDAASYRAVARFAGAINGAIVFTQTTDQATSVSVHLVGLDPAGTAGYPYHVHVLPVSPYDGACVGTLGHFDPSGANPGSNYTCDPGNVATCEVGDLSGKHGNLLPAADAATPVTASYTDSQVMLYGKNSIVGRSVVIHSADASAARLQCATIVEETTGAVTELMAVFRGEDIRGYMLFRQAVTSDGTVGDTVAFYDVQGLGGYTGPLNWHIHDAPISSPGDCASAGGHFDPTLYGTEPPAVNSKNTPPSGSYACNPANPVDTCEVGDMSGKFGALQPDASGRARGVVHDATIGIYNGHRINGLSVVIHNGSPRIACANLVAPAAVARFNAASVSGSVTFTKASGGRSTKVDVALHGLLLAGNYSYHIHELAAAGEGYCAYTKGHWDPFGATAPGPTQKTCAGGTATDCEVGDLSGKHGQLAGSGTSASLVSASYTDNTLVIVDFLYRSLVIHAPDGSRYACVTLVAPDDAVHVATASIQQDTFDMRVTLTQVNSFPTLLWAAYRNLPAGTLAYRIHSEPPVAETGSCATASVGGVFNPTGAAVPCATPSNVSSCAIGDLSGKWGDLVSTNSATMSVSAVDPTLSLGGASSVLGRSVVLYDAAGSPLACAPLAAVPPPQGTVDEAWALFASGAAQGRVVFQQVANGATIITVLLTKAPQAVLSLSVLDRPTAVAGGCPSGAVVYDPNRPPDATCTPHEDLATCAAGDLTGKHGPLSPTSGAVREVFRDPTLSLQGPTGIVGRTLRVFWTDNAGSHSVCAPITMPMLAATFMNGTTTLPGADGGAVPRSVGGGVTLVPAPSGGIQVSVAIRQGLAAGTHYAVAIQRTAKGTSSSACPETMDLYDPYDANNGLFGGRCTDATPNGCAAGALSNKASAAAYTASSAGTLDLAYVDWQLTLADAAERAVVVRESINGPVVACAVLAPYTVSGLTILAAEEPAPAPVEPSYWETAAGGVAIFFIVLLCLLVVGGVTLVVLRRYDPAWLPDRLRKNPGRSAIAL